MVVVEEKVGVDDETNLCIMHTFRRKSHKFRVCFFCICTTREKSACCKKTTCENQFTSKHGYFLAKLKNNPIYFQ